MTKKFRLEDIKNEAITNPQIIRYHHEKIRSNNYIDGTFKPLLDLFLDCGTCNCNNHECDRYCDSHSCGPHCDRLEYYSG